VEIGLATADAHTICIVEDDEAVRASTRLLLETAGYMVSDFASAESFLAMVDVEASFLVLDLNMREMNGLELLELLRARGSVLPAVMVTANPARLEARYRKAGVLAVLAKPASAKLLLEWIAKALPRR
jgi:FixJ family two-component response regulator